MELDIKIERQADGKYRVYSELVSKYILVDASREDILALYDPEFRELVSGAIDAEIAKLEAAGRTKSLRG
ncbi:hypothetical protein [Paenibacillus methanolicus]|uniref:Uncharacterized protein n=1 Tax=Paenibacillus methanolicus TaxID=582686 RepID=A0A5S5BN97_9BACL|nr:hypothetical protein [Paenibacillus methanolicus]TYP67680.1 hypothetical protein BCM02_1235 [Paenibacillus methanolicus]